jgi:cytochrome c biogenesis protein CcdA
MAACLLSFAAGALSLLSPCVLPLLPAALAAALAQHRLGALALAAGLTASATAWGLALAALGLALDRDLVRTGAAALLVALGAVLLAPPLERRLAGAVSPVAAWAAGRLARRPRRGLAPQLAAGALLGVVWTPCGGPTLASAMTLAAQRESLPAAAAVMGAYSAGAALPLLLLAHGARRALAAPDRLAGLVRLGRPLVGAALLAAGLLTLSGADKAIETAVLDRMPAWLVDLTTRW